MNAGSDKSLSDNSKPIIKCTTGDGCKTNDKLGKGNYIDSGKKVDGGFSGLIICDESKCESKSGDDLKEGYYIDNGDNTKIIYCTSAKVCNSSTNYNPGFYLDSGFEVSDDSEEMDEIITSHLIYCKDSQCDSIDSTTTTKLVEGYYLDASKVII